MNSPPNEVEPCAKLHAREWWNDEKLLNATDNLIEFGSAVWDYDDPANKAPKFFGDGREFAVKRVPSKEDLAMSAFIRFWICGMEFKPQDGVLGSAEFSDYMRNFRAPDRNSCGTKPLRETVVAKGLELFIKWKEALSTDRELVLYRALPRKFIGKDASFMSAGCFYTAGRYVSSKYDTPVEHNAEDVVIAMILVPVGTPVIKVVENRYVSRVVEYILPPGTLCPSDGEIMRPFRGTEVPLQPCVYVPGKRFHTTTFGVKDKDIRLDAAAAPKPRRSRKKDQAPGEANETAAAPKPRRSRKKDPVPGEANETAAAPKPRRSRKKDQAPSATSGGKNETSLH
jgi:hypothetical protein